MPENGDVFFIPSNVSSFHSGISHIFNCEIKMLDRAVLVIKSAYTSSARSLIRNSRDRGLSSNWRDFILQRVVTKNVEIQRFFN